MNKRFYARQESLALEISVMLAIACLLAIGLKLAGVRQQSLDMQRLLLLGAIVAPAGLYIWLKLSGRIRLLRPRARRL